MVTLRTLALPSDDAPGHIETLWIASDTHPTHSEVKLAAGFPQDGYITTRIPYKRDTFQVAARFAWNNWGTDAEVQVYLEGADGERADRMQDYYEFRRVLGLACASTVFTQPNAPEDARTISLKIQSLQERLPFYDGILLDHTPKELDAGLPPLQTHRPGMRPQSAWTR